MERRSSDVLLKLGDVVLKKTPRLDLSVPQQLPSYRYVYSRYLTLKDANPHNTSVNDVYDELGKELREIWKFMNVSPITQAGIRKKLKTLLTAFQTHRWTA